MRNSQIVPVSRAADGQNMSCKTRSSELYRLSKQYAHTTKHGYHIYIFIWYDYRYVLSYCTLRPYIILLDFSHRVFCTTRVIIKYYITYYYYYYLVRSAAAAASASGDRQSSSKNRAAVGRRVSHEPTGFDVCRHSHRRRRPGPAPLRAAADAADRSLNI